MSGPQFIEGPGDRIEADLESAASRFGALMSAGEFEEAFAAMQSVYREMVKGQRQGRRFHKGMPLANMGLARLYAGDLDGAFRYTAQAFIEDALSKGDERPDDFDELDMPAAHNLLYVFGVPGPIVARAAITVRQRQEAVGIVQDPERVFSPGLFGSLVINGAPGIGIGYAAAMIAAAGLKVPGQHSAPWEDRVFVAGRYRGEHEARLRFIQKEVESKGLEAVLAEDYVIPSGLNTNTQAVLLEHECSSAIFDMTEEGGWMIELERLKDFPIRPERTLLIYKSAGKGRPSGGRMTSDGLRDRNLAPVPFQDDIELRDIVQKFCRTIVKANARKP